MVQWWNDWKNFECFPFGSASLATEPAFVRDAFRICEGGLASLVRRQHAEQKRQLDQMRKGVSSGRRRNR